MTTFTSRKVIRDHIASLYTSADDWQSVYSGMPPVRTFAGQSPILTVLSDGTQTTLASRNMNPRKHRFLLATWVLYYRETDGTTYDEAEDELDALELVLTQTIHDNVGGSPVANLISFDNAFSDIRTVTIETGDKYKVEAIPIIVTLASGAL